MKTDSLIHELNNTSLLLHDHLNTLPNAKTNKEKTALDFALKQVRKIRELTSEIRLARSNELIADSLFMKPLHLIWLDDHIDYYQKYIEELKYYGIEIKPFNNGKSAIDYIREHEVDGALVDLKMPGSISGFDFIKATEGQIPCIVVSSYISHPELQRVAISIGSVGLLEKNLDRPGSNAGFAKAILDFFSPERRYKALERVLAQNTGDLKCSIQRILESLHELPDDTRIEIAPFLEEISTELAKEQPDIQKISTAGAAASNIAQGAVGSLAASGILHLLGALF